MDIPVRTIVTAVALALVCAAGAPARGATTGNLSLLVVPATWGPKPYSLDELRRTVVDEPDAFLRWSSGGRVSLTGTVVDWARLDLPRLSFCRAERMTEALRAVRPDVEVASYDRVAWVVPNAGCGFGGEAQQLHVVLDRQPTPSLTVHELGHTFGLGHARRWDCAGSRCETVEYGSTFSTMGGGAGDFHAYEKQALGWLGPITRPSADGAYTIAPIEGSSTQPQALQVTTAGAEYWFEARTLPVEPFGGHGPAQPPSVAVLGGITFGATAPSPFRETNLVLPNPAGGSRYGYVPGETFRVPGAFEVHVERLDASGAALRFRWVDRTPPPRPQNLSVVRRGTRVTIAWDPPVDTGSGRVAQVVVLDGKEIRRLGPLAFTTTLRLARGSHRVGVAALDRAGLRGRTATRRVVVR